MSVLIGKEIGKALKNKSINIEPLEKSQIGPGSIDLTLGNDFRIFKKRSKIYHIKNDSRFQDMTENVHVKDGDYIIIKPGEMILGITKEKITLADNISGRLEGRSRFARVGLMVHMTAGLIQPGCDNKQVLEISNMSPMPLALYPGTKICQIVLEEVLGEAEYTGRFRDQTIP